MVRVRVREAIQSGTRPAGVCRPLPMSRRYAVAPVPGFLLLNPMGESYTASNLQRSEECLASHVDVRALLPVDKGRGQR